MKKFISEIAGAAVRKRAIPLFVGQNVLEQKGLIRAVLAEAHPIGRKNKGIAGEQIYFVTENFPLLTDQLLHDETTRGVVFWKGDHLSPAIQEAYAKLLLPRLDVFIAVVTHEASDLVRLGQWSESFYKTCTRTFSWPDWSVRVEDHERLIDEMMVRLQASRRLRHVPELDRTARDLLRSTPFKGVDDVYHAIQTGYENYMEDPDASAMSARNIRGNALRTLSSAHRSASSYPPAD